MPVRDRFVAVTMAMAMAHARCDQLVVRMLMMRIVFVLVLHHVVGMLVFVALGDVKPHADPSPRH